MTGTEKNSGAARKLLFFSGGTALREVARVLARHTADMTHLVTPFDSGGSSAELRRAFGMPAVGDIRNRMVALADIERPGVPEIATLFAYRLPRDDAPPALHAELVRLARGRHPLLRQIPSPYNEDLQSQLDWFAEHRPAGFSLSGASIGNLILTAEYLRGGRLLAPAIARCAAMLQTRGTVQPIVDVAAHLAVRLASGQVVIGQHRFTGKETAALQTPIEAVWLVADETDPTPVHPAISPETIREIQEAACLCFPIGSFYSSVAANLLPSGVGRAVAASRGLKVFIPNLGNDPELLGHDVQQQIERLTGLLMADAPGASAKDCVNMVLADTTSGVYPAGGVPEAWLQRQGIVLRDARLVSSRSAPLMDSTLLAQALLQLRDEGATKF